MHICNNETEVCKLSASLSLAVVSISRPPHRRELAAQIAFAFANVEIGADKRIVTPLFECKHTNLLLCTVHIMLSNLHITYTQKNTTTVHYMCVIYATHECTLLYKVKYTSGDMQRVSRGCCVLRVFLACAKTPRIIINRLDQARRRLRGPRAK